MDRKSKFWRAKIFSKTLIGLEVAQLCWRVQPVIACICPSSSFTNSGKYKCKFTIQIYKYRQIQIQIYKYRHVSLSALAWSKDRLQNVNKGHLRSVLMSLCTNRNFFLCDCTPGCTFELCCHILGKPKQILLSRWKYWWVGDWCQPSKQRKGKRVEILCSTLLSPYLVIKDVTDMISMAIKKCSSYAVWQWKCVTMKKVVKEGTQRHLSCASPASQMRLAMRGTYVGATLWPRLFSLTKIQILFCTNTLNNLQKYTSRGWQRGERISGQLFDQDFLFRFLRR